MNDKPTTSPNPSGLAPVSDQLGKFRDAAQKSGLDESEAAFEGKLRAIAQRRPKPTSDGNSESNK